MNLFCVVGGLVNFSPLNCDRQTCIHPDRKVSDTTKTSGADLPGLPITRRKNQHFIYNFPTVIPKVLQESLSFLTTTGARTYDILGFFF